MSEAQNHRCAYCGVKTEYNLNGRKNKNNYATLDHIKCVSHGGTDSMANLVMACFKCNSVRGNIDAMEFYNELQKNINNPDRYDIVVKKLHKGILTTEQVQAKEEKKQIREATAVFNLWWMANLLKINLCVIGE